MATSLFKRAEKTGMRQDELDSADAVIQQMIGRGFM